MIDRIASHYSDNLKLADNQARSVTERRIRTISFICAA